MSEPSPPPSSNGSPALSLQAEDVSLSPDEIPSTPRTGTSPNSSNDNNADVEYSDAVDDSNEILQQTTTNDDNDNLRSSSFTLERFVTAVESIDLSDDGIRDNSKDDSQDNTHQSKDHDIDNTTDDGDDKSEISYGYRDAAPTMQTVNETQHHSQDRTSTSIIRKLSRRLSTQIDRRRTSIIESLPDTPQGWAVLSSTIAAAVLMYEINLQKRLTCPPLIYAQVLHDKANTSQHGTNITDDIPDLYRIYQRLSANEKSILRRNIQPSLFVGTRAVAASTASYLLSGPAETKQNVRYREVLTMPLDGAQIAIDWELPHAHIVQSRGGSGINNSNNGQLEPVTIDQVRYGPIRVPIVIVLHGLNNHSRFGYVQTLMRVCSNRGWLAIGLNFRGCGGGGLTTPRGYSGAYTNDMRQVIQILSGRLDRSMDVPIFLVGNSLGANVVSKYLGEEGLCNTLPDCVAGGITLGNPTKLDSRAIAAQWQTVLSLGCQKYLWQHIPTTFRGAKSISVSQNDAVRKALTAPTLEHFDEAVAPIAIRNDGVHPFGNKIGYEDGALQYWKDGSSYKILPYISVPTLNVVAADDFLVFKAFRAHLSYMMANPNVMVVETKCGGHLGWQEAPPNGSIGSSSSWSDEMTADFIQAVLDVRKEKRTRQQKNNRSLMTVSTVNAHDHNAMFAKAYAMDEAKRLHSRL